MIDSCHLLFVTWYQHSTINPPSELYKCKSEGECPQDQCSAELDMMKQICKYVCILRSSVQQSSYILYRYERINNFIVKRVVTLDSGMHPVKCHQPSV